MKIENIDINLLTPYKNNAKKHPKKQIEQIMNSIREFGMNDPIGIWGKDNIIVEGHGRYLACKKLGMTEVPCIRLDNLTDEQRKAYTLAHNKVAESEFDWDMIELELEDINLDMEQFGFEFVDEEEEHKEEQAKTQKRVANILNLEIAQYHGVGKYDIPELEPIYNIPEITEWIGFNCVLSDKTPNKNKGVHFFIDDYQFIRIWNNPDAYVKKLSEYGAVIAPDFSPYGDMPLATQIFNHYRKHWVAKYLQERGVNIIPCIRASTDERSLEFYLEGEPKGGIVAISSMWTNSQELKEYFKREYNTMIETLKPSKILVYGSKVDGLKGNIEYIESFTSKRWNNG
jgi:hypothetical protein